MSDSIDTSAQIKLFDSKDQFGDMSFLNETEEGALQQSTYDVSERQRTLVIDQGDIYNSKRQQRQVMSLCNFDDENKILPP